MKKIKIAYYIDSLYKSSGMATLAVNYFKKIDKEKFEFVFIYSNVKFDCSETYVEEIEKLGGKVFKVCSPFNFIKFFKELKRIYKVFEWDIFHNHVYLYTLPLFIQNIIITKSKFVTHIHSERFSENKIKNIIWEILSFPNIFLPICNFSCSKSAGKIYLKGIKEAFVLRNAINYHVYKFDSEQRIRIRKKYGLSEDNLVIGHVGRLSKTKNHEFILSVFSECLKKNPNMKLLLVGDGPLRNYLQNLSCELKLADNVIFAGFQKDSANYYSAMDLFLYPSLFEGVPLGVIEAEANGLPCLLSNGITQEVDINNVIHKDINEDINVWYDAIVFLKNKRLKDWKFVYEYFKKSGFEINVEVRAIERKYIEILSITNKIDEL